MISQARSSTVSSNTFIVSLDVGTSSVRALLYDGQGRQVEGCGEQLTYEIKTTSDGGVEVDADELFDLSVRAISKLHGQVLKAGLKPAGVGISAFWHSFLGVSSNGRPSTPILHLFDTRATEEVKKLKSTLDPVRVHER